jgi:predicted nucleic-acid-binding protein
MQDDEKQSPRAALLIEALTAQSPGYVPLVTIVELAWVMSSSYDLDRTQLLEAMVRLLRTKELIVERAEIVWQAIRVFQVSNADFADCLIERSAAAAGCAATMTFDRGAAKSAGMTLVA